MTLQRLHTLLAWTLLTVAFASGTLQAHAQIESTEHPGCRSSSYHYTSRTSSYHSRSDSHYRSRSYRYSYPTYRHHGYTRAVYGVRHDSHGRIARSAHARRAFERQHPCPSTGRTSGACPGYVVDHIRALKRGGADDPSNMQWQTTQDAKIKDRAE